MSETSTPYTTGGRMDGAPMHGHPAIEFLAALRRGALLDDFATGYQEVVDAVEESGKAGAITLKIAIKPLKGASDQLEVSEQITTKAPAADTAVSHFWVLEDGRLSRRDPRQPSLPSPVGVDPIAESDDQASEGAQSA